jgi:hypothetical protein
MYFPYHTKIGKFCFFVNTSRNKCCCYTVLSILKDMISLNSSFTAKYVVHVLSMSNQNGEKLLFLNTSPKRSCCYNVLPVVTSMIFS